jgi:hypothetical protein
MSESASLLKEEPYLLAPDIDLTKNTAASRIDKERDKCEKCGKVLGFPYYLMIGIPPSHSIINICKCGNLEDERHEVEFLIGLIQFAGKDFNIENKH